MTATNKNPERRIRPFSDFLLEISAGLTHHDLSEALNELVQAVDVVGKPGSITYTLKVAPAGRGAEQTVMVTDEIKVKLPEADRPDSVFFIDADGNMTRSHPDQERLPLREVPKPRADADPATGEIKEAN